MSSFCGCPSENTTASQHPVLKLFCSSLRNDDVWIYSIKHTHIRLRLQHGAYTASEVKQPIGIDRARSPLGTSHPPSIKIHETSATRRSWLVLPHAQYELNTNIVAASLKK